MAEIERSTHIDGLVIVEPTVHGDERGLFAETFRQEWLAPGAPPMIQANRADRTAGVGPAGASGLQWGAALAGNDRRRQREDEQRPP